MLERLQELLNQTFMDKELLGIEQAACLMRCSVDTVRRISCEELPVYRVGRENVYLREEIIKFVRSKRVRSFASEGIIDDVMEELEGGILGVVDSGTVDVREPSRRRRK